MSRRMQSTDNRMIPGGERGKVKDYNQGVSITNRIEESCLAKMKPPIYMVILICIQNVPLGRHQMVALYLVIECVAR